MRASKFSLLFLLALACWCPTDVLADPITFTLTPSPNLAGTPGSTVVWSYVITNGTAMDFQTLDLAAGLFVSGTPDASLFDFPFVPAGATVSGMLFGFAADPVPSFNSGFFTIATDIGVELTAEYSVTIADQTPVPEPATWLLLGAGLVGLAARMRRRP